MASPLLDKEQQVFLLSILSNAASSIKGTKKELQDLLKTDITKYLNAPSIQEDIGNWDLVWGPVVYKPLWTKYAINAMYVAQNGNQYVVAIAGTNPKSYYDWLKEDFNVKKQVSWPYGDIPPDIEPKISKGTYTGLKHLQKMKSSGKTVLEFLGEKNSDDEIEIIFTGHSLGGALSPALALAAKNEWAGEKPFKISVYPSAGPTPGNQDFSTYYDSQLGNSTTRIWNDIDIVPHAWNETMLSEIPYLYLPEIEPSRAVSSLVEQAKKLADGGNYTQILPETPGLEGTVSLPSDPPLCDETEGSEETTPESNYKTFMKQAITQHTSEYAVLLNVQDPYCIMFEETKETLFAPPDSSEFEELLEEQL